MAHGAEDYTKTTSAKVVAAKVDLDLPVIVVDRFDSANFLWIGVGLGVDAEVHMEAGAAYEGDAGMALRTSLAAVAPFEWVEADRYIFTTPTRKLSFSTLFRINNAVHNVFSLSFQIHGRYNGMMYHTGMRYRTTGRDWDFYDNTGNWVDFLADMTQYSDAWERMYFEIDLENMQYIAFETADQRINLQGTPIWTNAVPGIEQTIIAIVLTAGIPGTRSDVSIDNLIVKELGS